MATVPIPAGKVPPVVADIGRLVGVLTGTNDDLALDFGWFGSVPSKLGEIPSRRDVQWQLLGDLLGSPAYSPAGQSWYSLPFGGADTPVYIVMQPATGGTGGGIIGIGLLNQHEEGSASLVASAFAPVFNTAAGGAFVVTGSSGFPIQLSLACTFPDTVSSLFTTATLDGQIYVDGTAPSFSLNFTGGPHGPLAVATLEQLLAPDAASWVNAALADPFAKAWLDTNIGSTSVTRGAALEAAGLLAGNGNYSLADLSGFANMTAVAIAEALLAGGLKALASNADPILPLGTGGIWVFGDGTGPTEYGLRLHVEDIPLVNSSGAAFKLQLGKMLAADTDDSNWVSRGDPPAGAVTAPGVSLTLVTESAATPPVPSFSPRLDLVSIGVDLDGAGGNPLLDVEGVTLASVQPRFLFSWSPASGAAYWGAAVQADQLGLPLGDGLGSSSTNPVAQNLLSSGGGSGGDSAKVNPAFSLSLGGISQPDGSVSLDVQLHSDVGTGDQVWIPVQRSFGPLQCSRVGVCWPGDSPPRLDFLFDGGVSLAVLKIDLQGLSLGIPLASPGDLSSYDLDLQGMGLSYVSGPLTISGAFVKVPGPPVEYDGLARIEAANWSIAAEGSYATLDGQPSMFIFAQLDAELGGPPFFFVTGLCAGFGYNRSLRIPTQDEISDFPLLAAIGGPDLAPAQALDALTSGPNPWIAPAQGVDWIAAGVQFSSFELVQSNVVVTAIMAEDFQAALVGISRIKLAQTGPQFAYAELDLEVVIRPSDGYIGASAVLAPNSYLLTPDCHLTGGFAFWIWYAGDYAGDFVLTLGGYHPAFTPPPHYPLEPRLGFSWHVSDNITVQGESYFALTPSCAMGGGSLEVLFHSGDLRAWFTAQADFLFNWKPFYFIGDVGVSIGASYRINLLFTSVTVSVELGASLDIWGPPTGGKVHVSWYIISFSVGFGADEQLPDGYQSWEDFTTLLPKRAPPPSPPPPPPAVHAQSRAAFARAAVDPAPTDPAATGIISLSITAGLLGTDNGDWLVRGDSMTFAIATPIPATSAVLDGAQPYTYETPSPGNAMAIRPMGVASATSILTVTISGPGPTDKVELGQVWAWTPTIGAVPESLWGAPLPEKTTPTAPSANTLPGRLIGFTGLTPPVVVLTGPAAFPQDDLDFYVIDDGNSHWLPLSAGDSPAARQPQQSQNSIQQIADTVAATAVAELRTQIRAALASFGYDPGADGDMSALRDNVDFNYPVDFNNPDAPMIGSPWQAAA